MWLRGRRRSYSQGRGRRRPQPSTAGLCHRPRCRFCNGELPNFDFCVNFGPNLDESLMHASTIDHSTHIHFSHACEMKMSTPLARTKTIANLDKRVNAMELQYKKDLLEPKKSMDFACSKHVHDSIPNLVECKLHTQQRL